MVRSTFSRESGGEVVLLPSCGSDRQVSAESGLTTPALHLIAIFLLWGAIYVAGMFTPALLDDVDTVHAEAAREMLLRHDWVTLYTNGIRYLEKAPLPYWSVAASYTLFGVHDWSTRLPLMLAVLATLLVTYALGTRAYGRRAGFYSAVVLATCVGPYIYTRFQIPDAMVGLWLALSYYFFLRFLEKPSRFACWGFAAACALNVLTKSLIGLVFPLATVGVYLILTGNLRRILQARLISSSVVFLLIAAPWHILAALRNPAQGAVRGFLWFYFVNEQFLRYVNKRVPPGYDTVPLLIFYGLLLVWLLPWVIFLPQSLRNVPYRWRQWRGELSLPQKANLLFTLWVVVIVGFFSFSTRQEYYTLPALPGLALLIGSWLAKESDSTPDAAERRAGQISSAVFLALAVVGAAVGLALLISSRTPPPGTDLATLLSRNPTEYDLSLGHVLDLTPEALGALRVPLLGAVVSLLAGAAANWWMRRRGNPRRGNFALAVMMVALLASVHSAFVTFSPILSSKDLADAVQRYYRPGSVIVVDGEYHQASTLNFYTRVPLLVLHEPSGNLWYGSKFPDAPNVFETQASFEKLWAGPATVFLWSEQENPRALQGLTHHTLATSGGKYIFTNQLLTEQEIER